MADSPDSRFFGTWGCLVQRIFSGKNICSMPLFRFDGAVEDGYLREAGNDNFSTWFLPGQSILNILLCGSQSLDCFPGKLFTGREQKINLWFQRIPLICCKLGRCAIQR